MKKLAFIALMFITIGASAANQDTLKYRISLLDKAATTYSLNKPEEFLSKKALARRERQHLVVDSTDLPVCAHYVETIRKKGVRIVTTGKWDNFVTVACSDSAVIDEISRLPFVRSAERVWRGDANRKPVTKRDSLINKPAQSDSLYGPAFRQIGVSNAQKLHAAGYKGQGMTIAVIDAGYHNVDKITAMNNIRILGVKDFVEPQSDIYAQGSHGMAVLSCMAMNKPNVMIGTAPEASYWLLRTEDEASENLVEQDYWAAAIEFADSVGVDVVNTSLGYYTFDDSTKDYAYHNLDGQYALMSRQSGKVADKGMILVCSAGNSGASSWKKITVPGDAENVLTVGAVDKRGVLAPFSSIGNTADNRVKPDVVAVGLSSDVMGTNGNLRKASGTSFASPILCGMVACLWQACPQLTAKEVIELVRQSGNRVAYPDNIYGYGVPDMWKAYKSLSPDLSQGGVAGSYIIK